MRPISEREQQELSTSPSRAYKQLWSLHELPLSTHLHKMSQLGKLSRNERKQVREALKARLHQALQQAYPEQEFPDWEELH